MMRVNHFQHSPLFADNKTSVVSFRNPASPFLVSGVESNINVFPSVDDVIVSLGNGDKSAISSLEQKGIPYILEEDSDSYKVKFESDGTKYTISYVDGSQLNIKPEINTNNVSSTKQELDEIIDKLFRQGQEMFDELNKIPVPVTPLGSDYSSESEYNKALEEYHNQSEMYDQQVLEYNKKIAGLQLASDVYETQGEMLENIEQQFGLEIPTPPILSEDMSEAEYNSLLSIYERELAEYRDRSSLYDLRGKMLSVKMSSTMALLNWLTSKLTQGSQKDNTD